ncbi:hypothetical protein MKL11_00130, partial [Methylobacterium sp. J-077]|nr:hypothetical protein [Methylobacterium sp. J-077]
FEMSGSTAGSDVGSTNLLAYTATFGNGLSATLSIEVPVFRRTPLCPPSGGARPRNPGRYRWLGHRFHQPHRLHADRRQRPVGDPVDRRPGLPPDADLRAARACESGQPRLRRLHQGRTVE